MTTVDLTRAAILVARQVTEAPDAINDYTGAELVSVMQHLMECVDVLDQWGMSLDRVPAMLAMLGYLYSLTELDVPEPPYHRLEALKGRFGT